jgi:signal transduction histidine kinase/CheY-like chemotaxis protein
MREDFGSDRIPIWRAGAAATAGVLLCLGMLNIHAQRERARERVFRVGFDGAPPLSEIGPNGEAQGLAVSLLREAAKMRGIRLEWVPLGGITPDEALTKGSVDIWPAVGITERRRQMYHLTEPWLSNTFALVSRKERSAVEPSELVGKEVAFTGFPVAARMAGAHLPNVRLQKTSYRAEVLERVCDQTVDAGFEEASFLNMLLLDRPAACSGVALRVQLVHGATFPVGIAARFDAAEAADELRSGLDDLAATGVMPAALDRWASFSSSETRSIFELRASQERRGYLQAGLIASLATMVLLGWQVFRANRAATKARKANGAKSEFLANISHEIRTPMNGIMGMLDVALEGPIGEEKRADLQIARDSSAALLAVLTDALDLSKIEAGRMELVETVFDPAACVSGVMRLFQGAAREKGLDFVLACAADLPKSLMGDEIRLRQVLTNLVSNAVKFTERGGIRVEVVSEALPTAAVRLRITVKDTGQGIPSEHQRYLFQKFMQVDGSTHRRHGGTGLGLAVSKAMVELMGGTITFGSVPGEGSWFRVEIPMQVAEASPATQTVRVTKSGGKVLIVEDNRVNQIVIKKLVQDLGYVADVAENGAVAVECSKSTRYVAILMDCHMPVMDGFEATEAIRTGGHSNWEVPIIAVTACAMQGDRERCFAVGMNGYLTKPVSKAELQKQLP